jgi:hypothetical protein
VGEALLVASAAAILVHLLQRRGFLDPAWSTGRDAAPGRLAPIEGAAETLGWWTWPALGAFLAHLLLGPKQRRPVFLRHAGAMYAYAGVRVDRNGGCRGGCITGATGSGKTLACIIPRLHSLCVNEAGTERPEWPGSPAQRAWESLRTRHRELAAQVDERTARLAAQLRRAGPAGRRWDEPLSRRRGAGRARIEGTPAAPAPAEVARLREQREGLDRDLQAAGEPFRRMRYRVAPWGGFVCGEKGNEWQSIEALLRHHRRDEDLCLLRTRPADASPGWSPAVRLNLLSLGEIPADTYAKAIVDTGLAVEEAEKRDEFFVPQARDKIAWGLRLTREVGAAARAAGRAEPGAGPSLLTLFDILTVHESYRAYLLRNGERFPDLAASSAFSEARFQLENNYWSQPPEQLGGVRSTLYNFLVPFAEPEVAAVFCRDSTFDLRDIEQGKVVCLAIPQKFALQRRYVTTLMKTLVYQIILERFDRRGDHPDWLNRNVLLVEQDEWQRNAVRADCETDVVREARGAVYAAAQSQNAVWLKLGGRDRATPLLANLRNRWICQAATQECAEESSNLVSGRACRDASYSYGPAGRTTNVSFPDQPFLPRRELRTLPPFHVVFVPAEGDWLYRTCIAMPAGADGSIPPWWFGDWNPLHWAARWLALPAIGGRRLGPPDDAVPPWRACAPLRAQVRWLLGLDGTFIILGGMRSAAALKAARRRGNG